MLNTAFLGIPLAAVLGGLLIGLAAVLLYVSLGRIAGISGILFGALNGEGLWRWMFLLGLLLGAWGMAQGLPNAVEVSRPSPGVLTLILAGVLVGFGTRLGNGCTSGHGVCGLGRLSLRSWVAVLAFMAAGVFMASVGRYWLAGVL